MLFNTIAFWLFYAIVFVFYFLSPVRYRWALLLFTSYYFYAGWNPAFLLLIWFSTLVDYLVGRRLQGETNPAKRKLALTISLTTNLGLLFIFKYWNFFFDSVAEMLRTLGFNPQLGRSNLLLPVGISFYTFQTLSYTIDIYRNKLKAENHFGKFALYVAFFPQLVAGPIERATNLLPQLQSNANKFNYQDFSLGLSRAMLGLFKKVVVADSVALYVNAVYNNYEVHNGVTLAFATYLFAFQIYCDFSGYSDIAIGVARMLGYKFQLNFNLPYFSKSVTEFWRRWHISLSSWLRDYLYIPLGGSRKGLSATYRNLMVTMLLGGLWHGASWNFVIWGFLNGLSLSVEKWLGLPSWNLSKNWLTRIFSAFITFHLICLTWIFFRAETLTQATVTVKKICLALLTLKPGQLFIPDIAVFATILVGLFLLLCYEFAWERQARLEIRFSDSCSWFKLASFNAILLILICLLGVSNGSQFIYFQF